jgi:hypothetical protein
MVVLWGLCGWGIFDTAVQFDYHCNTAITIILHSSTLTLKVLVSIL